MSWITDPNVWLALLTLTALEIVLGIDNIILNLRIHNRRLEPVRLRKPRSAIILRH